VKRIRIPRALTAVLVLTCPFTFAIGILMPIMMVSMHSGFVVVTPSATRHDGRLESEC
jgi:hypothetical protein